MFEHFFPQDVRLDVIWGRLGVRLFFVLSGFLITGILLKCRLQYDVGRTTRLFSTRQFYLRRFLRIVPLFYAAIVVMMLIGPSEVRTSAPWHFAYLSNFYTALHPNQAGVTSHFWSLAVEEQFYFLWPWVILFLPWRFIPSAIGTLCCVGPAYRAVGFASGWSREAALWLTPACFDTLGFGALLAYLVVGRRAAPERVRTWAIGAVMLGLPILVYAYSRPRTHGFLTVMGDVGCGLTFSALVYAAAIGFKGRLGRALEWAPITYIGKISYGIYVIHFFVPYVYLTFLTPLGFPSGASLNGTVYAMICVGLSVLLASGSWWLLERPINRHKRRFPYWDGDRPTTTIGQER